MVDIHLIISVVRVSVSVLEFQLKVGTVRLYTEQDLTIHCLQEAHFSFKDKNMLKVKERKIIYYANNNPRRTGEPTLISNKTDIKRKKM